VSPCLDHIVVVLLYPVLGLSPSQVVVGGASYSGDPIVGVQI